MNQRTCLIFSAGLNAILLAWLLHRFVHTPAPVAPRVEWVTNVVTVNRPVELPAAAGPSAPDEPFRWGRMVSPDFRVYAATLRAIECPGPVMRDILLPEISDYYWNLLWPLLVREHGEFWERAVLTKTRRKPDVPDKKKLRAEIDRLLNEHRELCRELFGNVPNPPEPHELEEEREDVQRTGFLSPDKQARVLAIEREAGQLRRELRGQRIPEPEVQARVRQYRDGELRDLLSPAELEEYQLRASRYAGFRHELYGFNPTPDEARAIVRLLEESGGDTSLKARVADIQRLLEPGRFAEFQRAADEDFQTLYKVVDRYEQPEANAIEIFQRRQLAEEASRTIRQNPALTEEQKRSALQEIREAAETEVTGILGRDAFSTYSEHAGEWLRHLGSTTGQPR